MNLTSYLFQIYIWVFSESYEFTAELDSPGSRPTAFSRGPWGSDLHSLACRRTIQLGACQMLPCGNCCIIWYLCVYIYMHIYIIYTHTNTQCIEICIRIAISPFSGWVFRDAPRLWTALRGGAPRGPRRGRCAAAAVGPWRWQPEEMPWDFGKMWGISWGNHEKWGFKPGKPWMMVKCWQFLLVLRR